MRRRWFGFQLAVLSLGAVMLGACSSGGTASPSTSSAASGETVATGPAPTGAALCNLTPTSDLATALGLVVRAARPIVSNGDVTCTYFPQKNVTGLSVTIHYDTGATAASFSQEEQTFAQDGERTHAVADLGDQAFSSSITTEGQGVSTVVVRKGSELLSVTAPAPLGDVESLLRNRIVSRFS